MNKRLPLLLSLIGVILLAASLAYWILQLYQPPQRPLAAVPLAAVPEPAVDAAATLFGGQLAVATATNYQLTGVVSAGRDSVAIIVADGSPAKALKVGKELSPGVTLAEVYPRYVMLSDGGVMKRVDLAPDTKPAAPMGGQGVAGAPIAPPPPAAQTPPPPLTPASMEPAPAGAAPAENAQPEPPMSPGAVSQQMPGNQSGRQESAPPPPNANSITPPPTQVQMAPPTRGSGSPVGQTPPTQ